MTEGRFVTYVLGLLDTNKHTFTFANAGHLSPQRRNAAGEVVDLIADEQIGMPIGIIEGMDFDVVEYALEPGDTIAIVTDGVDEAMNSREEQFTKERYVQVLAEGPGRPVEAAKHLLGEVRKHADGFPQNDDITIMMFGRT